MVRVRIFLIVLGASLLLILGLIFRQFVEAEIILPTATMVWLILRIFVLSIGQAVYWWILVFLAMAVAIIRLFRAWSMQPQLAADTRLFRDRASYWRDSIRLNVHNDAAQDTFRREVTWLLTAFYSSPHHGPAKYQVREAFLDGRIPLPESLHAFLFSSPLSDRAPSFLRHPLARLEWICTSARRSIVRWLNRRSGRQAAEYFKAIDETLAFMETTTETKYDQNASDRLDV